MHAPRWISTIALGLGACGSSPPPAPALTSTAPRAPTAATGDAIGTSGLPGLDWGANADAVLARYPRGRVDAGGVVYAGTVEGHPAIARFTIGAGGLGKIAIDWTEGFPTMDLCARTWGQLRATLDARLGPSQAENLAAYWDLPAASVTLACNPDDSGAGVLSQTYEPRSP
jgi:hypothetical protein